MGLCSPIALPFWELRWSVLLLCSNAIEMNQAEFQDRTRCGDIQVARPSSLKDWLMFPFPVPQLPLGW